MRTTSILILLIGAVASEPFFQSGTEHEFLYKGKMMTGIPELDSQYSGLTMESKVIVQSLGSQQYKLAMKNIRYTKFNERLSEDRSENWRQLEVPEAAPVPSEHQTYLEYPIEFSMQDGEIRDIKVSGEEPEWATNLKKSLVSLIKVQLPSQHDRKSNAIRGSSSFPKIWEVMEQGVDGKCENTYQVNEIPESELQELVEAKYITRERCLNKKIYQVMKTRNVNRCSERTSYQVNQPGKTLCPTGNCDNMWQRTSMTRYFGCGSSEENMELEIIVNEAELQQNLRAYKTETIVTGVRQMLKVEEVRTELTTLPNIPSPRTIEGLYYEYPLPKGEKSSSYRDQQEKLREMPITSDFLSALGNKDEHSILSKLSPVTLKQRIVKQLEKITEDLEEVEEFGKKQVAANVMAVSKVFSLLSTEDMKALYEEIKEHSTTEHKREQMRQLLQEIAVITGTSPAVVFTRHLIESREMGIVRSTLAISTLPHYIRTPTIKLINEVFELVKSPIVQEHESVKINAMLAFGTIVNKACLDSNRFERFPVFVYGEFCNSKNTEITKEYIPYLVKQLESARNQGEKIAAILALGNLGHESALQILMPYIEGRDEVTPLEQRMAIYSIHNFDEDRRSEVMKIYSSLVFNPSEERDTRIAALSMMLNLEPSTVVFQKLATSTWFEQDTEFHKFVYATLKSLSKIEESEQPNAHTSMYRNSHKAKQVIDMAKPVPTIFSYALNHFAAEYLKNLEVGYHTHYAHTVTEKMQHFYGKIEYFLQQLKFTPVEFCAHMTGKDLTHEVSKLFSSQDKKSSSEWEEIVSRLSIKDQDKEATPFHAGIWARIFDDVQVMYGIEPHHIEPTIEKVKKAIRDPKSLKNELCGKTPFNIVKVNNLASTEVVIPSDMGFPIIIELHMPSVISVEGELEVKCSGVLPTVSLEVTKKASTSMSGYVGTICPLTMDVIATGVEEQYAVNFPIKMTTLVKNNKINMVFTDMKNVKSSTQEIDFMYYNIRPFSTIKPIVFIDGLPLVQHKETKTLKSEDEVKSLTLPYGESIGLDMKLKMKTETNVIGAQGLIEYASLYKYNPVNMALFSWTSSAMTKNGQPSCREHEVKLVYNPSRSQTDEVEIDLDFYLALKSKKSEPKIVKIKSQHQQQQQQQHNQQQQQQQQQGIQIQQEQMDASRPEHQKIKQILKKLEIEEGFGLTTKFEINFRGGAPKTYSYSLSAAHGFRNLNQKWNLHLESPHAMNVCVEGESIMPKVSLREEQSSKLEVFYKNTLGFGKTCEEHKIEVRGTTGVSIDQVERSRSSEESRECRDYSRKITELREELKSKSEESSEYKRLTSELVQVHEKKQESCEERREQERTLDEVKFEITHTPMPEYVRQYARYLDIVVKGALAPYMTKYKSTNSENKIEVELSFNKKSHSFNIILTTEDEEIKYKDIRMPEYLRDIIPMEASYDSIKKVASSIKGSSLYPRCKVEQSIVESFDKKSYQYQLDDCYHVLSAETEQEHEYAVLAKEQDGKKELKVFVSGSKLTIRHKKKEEFEIEFDGERVELEKNEKKELRTRGEGHSCKLWRSNDDVIVVETPFSRIIYDAKTVEIENTRLTHTQLKGLCGNSNQDKRDESVSAQGCIANTAEIAALTFRVQEKSCSALSQQKKIQQQQQQCKKVRTQQQQQRKTVQLAQLANKDSVKCSQMKHALIRQGQTICISQIPVVECGNGCEAKISREKVISYTCLPANRPRVAKLYEEKIRRGEILPELRNMEQSFSTEMKLPSSCAHPGF